MRKKVDARVRTLIENGVKLHHRSLFILVGDGGREQVVNLHYMLSKAAVRQRPSVLWCYKKDLGFTSHRKKRMKQVKKMIQRGLLDPEKDDPFELFISATDISYCYYKETARILGNTFGMLVLQDFEAVTPNVLARTVETVEGGGIVVLLLKSMDSLKQLYTMSMDAHARFRTEAHADVQPRFNERFILSLASCAQCLVLDDELNVLPISTHCRAIKPVNADGGDEDEGSGGGSSSSGLATPSTGLRDSRELRELKASLRDTQPVGSIVSRVATVDQAKAVLTFVEAAADKGLRTTVALTAGRGRGKSAALGLALAAAIAYGYANIFVTSPSPENLRTLFQFVLKGFDALDYKEHVDFTVVESANPDLRKAVVRINVFHQHRQTIQYIEPTDHKLLAQAELLVVDEAAAIPMPQVRALLGPYLVFLASTVNGYEGTGRALSLKLIQQLRTGKAAGAGASDGAAASSVVEGAALAAAQAAAEGGVSAASLGGDAAGGGAMGRALREVSLDEPIRYARGDPIEKWLHDVLCLDATSHTPAITGCPHPSECDLYFVDRDALFSYHSASEAFLQRMIALFVASHYKNTPNDLQLMSDAPAHQLFVLLGPVDINATRLPDVLAVVQHPSAAGSSPSPWHPSPSLLLSVLTGRTLAWLCSLVAVDVLGKSAEAVAATIMSKLGDASAAGCVLVLQGLSGTGKGTTVGKLEKLLPRCTSWSNGNVFRCLTLLAVTRCEREGIAFGPEVLTAPFLADLVRCLSFGKYGPGGAFDTKVEGYGLGFLVSEVQNTTLKDAKVGKNIPTVAKMTQGEVVMFAGKAAETMRSDGMNVLMEGRAQTLNYVRTPHRFELTLSAPIIIGQRRAAQRMMAKALEKLAPVQSSVPESAIKAILGEAIKELTR